MPSVTGCNVDTSDFSTQLDTRTDTEFWQPRELEIPGNMTVEIQLQFADAETLEMFNKVTAEAGPEEYYYY